MDGSQRRRYSSMLAARALRPETQLVGVDDPELARRCQDAWYTLFQEAASSDGARQGAGREGRPSKKAGGV